MTVTVTLRSVRGANRQQKALVERSCSLLQQAINSPGYLERVERATYTETRLEQEDGSVVVVRPGDVLDYVLQALQPGSNTDEEMELSIKLVELPSPMAETPGRVGSATTRRLPFDAAYWFIDGCLEDDDAVSPARLFMHEWLHVAGFIHYPRDPRREDVPYVLAEIVRQVLTQDVRQPAEARESPRMRRLLDEADEHVYSGLGAR